MATTIKVGHFCGLGSSREFKNWLSKTAPDLLDMLISNPQKGCKSRQEKMITIYNELHTRGLGDKLIAFIKERFPYMVQTIPDQQPNVVKDKPPLPHKQLTHIEDLNKHGVFAHYRPDLLTFPQKYIMVGEPDKLPDMVQQFIRDKVGVDYIIIDNTAYIEYFHKKYSDIAAKINPEDREIAIFRRKMQQIR